MKLRTLVEDVPGLRVGRGGRPGANFDVDIDDIVIDSRRVGPGALFVALVGANADGHDYVDAAVDAGAEAVLVEAGRADEVRGDSPVLVADDTRAVLGELAAEFYRWPCDRLWVVGVTGTNGKTTVTYLLEAVYRAARSPVGVIGTVNYRWRDHVEEAPNTTPESLVLQRLMRTMVDDGVQRVVMEVSSHGLATHRLGGTTFDVGVFTNLSQDHLDFHETMEEYRAAKASFFTDDLPRSARAGKQPVAVLNVDDPEGRRLASLMREKPGIRTVTFGLQEGADVRAVDVVSSLAGLRLTIEATTDAGEGAFDIETGLLGSFNVSNILATSAASLASGISSEAISRGLGMLSGVPGRLQRIDDDRRTVFVDYAHTPDALERVTATIRDVLEDGDLWLVFGAGGDRDRSKRAPMGEAAARLADHVVVTSDNPRSEDPESIVEDILAGISDDADATVETVVDRRDAIRCAIAGSAEEDVVLIAGKGHETYQEIAGERRAFDDAEEVRKALATLRE